jgi:hypothetical protein
MSAATPLNIVSSNEVVCSFSDSSPIFDSCPRNRKIDMVSFMAARNHARNFFSIRPFLVSHLIHITDEMHWDTLNGHECFSKEILDLF